MKKLLVLMILFGFAQSAPADLPFEIQVIDFDQDTDVDGDDIQAAIDLCGISDFFQGGCTIVLPRDTISLTSTLVLGSGTDYPVGLIFRGQGSCSRASNPPGLSGGTVLLWDGPDNGTMIEIQRAHRIRFENLCLALDPDVVAGGPAAQYGFHFAGDVRNGKITQGTVFQNVGIWGPVGTPPAGMTGVYITGTGAPKSAQNDKMLFLNCYIRDVDIGIHQDALQALLNIYQGGSLFAYTTALKVSGGNFDLRDTVVGCKAVDCVVLHMAFQQFSSHQETLFSNIYWESGSPKTFLKIADGWSSTNSNLGNNSPVVVENSYMTNQRTGTQGSCQQTLLDAATRAPVIFRGNHLFATGDFELDCGFDLRVSNSDQNAFTTIHWSENQIRAGAPAEFMNITLTGPYLGIVAIAVDPETGALFNDRNLNRLRDSSEEPFGGDGDPGPGGPEVCDDGIDNDGDGKIDCQDKPDCREDPAC
jgi:hypothetical protein